jgi:GTP-binding protein
MMNGEGRARLPLVAIVGRPNVGKSTLFNRIIEERKAIVDKTPGVTRDRIYSEAQWCGFSFCIIDTAGLPFWDASRADCKTPSTLEDLVNDQVKVAIDEADLLLLVVDGRRGLLPQDKEIANALRKAQKSVIVAVNKVDNPEKGHLSTAEFFEIGLGEPVFISAEHGINIGDLLDGIAKALREGQEIKNEGRLDVVTGERKEKYEENELDGECTGECDDEEPGYRTDPGVTQSIRVAIVGRPNVGKSSLLNALIGEERALVHSEPGTTRDIIDATVRINGGLFTFVDTAGLRRRTRLSDPVERYSTTRTLRSIRVSDVVLLLIDPLEGLTGQDKRIAGLVDEAGKGLVVAANKWDYVRQLIAGEGDDNRNLGWILNETKRNLEGSVKSGLHFASYAPFLAISAKTGFNLKELTDQLSIVWTEHGRRLKTREVNDILQTALRMQPPPVTTGRRRGIAIKYGAQVGVRPPRFELFGVHRREISESYVRYIESVFRQHAGFTGTPLRFIFRPL